jgi:hypothetical protein
MALIDECSSKIESQCVYTVDDEEEEAEPHSLPETRFRVSHARDVDVLVI